jgi:hypothetical protein
MNDNKNLLFFIFIFTFELLSSVSLIQISLEIVERYPLLKHRYLYEAQLLLSLYITMSHSTQQTPADQEKYPYIPICTTEILLNYARAPLPDIPDGVLQRSRFKMRIHVETVEELREWVRHRESSVIDKIMRIFLNNAKIKMPPEQKLCRSIDYFFPPRFRLPVTISDFGDGMASRRKVYLGDIERGTLEAN